jgi:hypothetical protein
MMLHVKSLSAGNPVAEVFLIGWAFAATTEVSSQHCQWHC